jgi:hypothetical protein
MVNLRRLSDRAKKVVDKRGGMDSLKEDAAELRDIAKAAGTAVKDPGAKGPDQPGERRPAERRPAPGQPPEAEDPATRSK